MYRGFLVGYILILLGLLGLVFGGYGVYASALPPLVVIGGKGAVLSGPMFLIYLGSSITLLFPGAYMVRNDRHVLRKWIGVGILIASITIPTLIFVSAPSILLLLPMMILFPLASSIILITGEFRYGIVVLMLALLSGSGALLNP